LLLDTNFILWLELKSDRIAPRLTEAIIQYPELVVSPLSLVEISIKYSTKKLNLELPPESFWQEFTSRFQLREVAFNEEHARRHSKLPLLHRDPFDRMLVAQCLVENARIATTDLIFGAYGVELFS